MELQGSMCGPSRQSGVTLVELMVTIVVAAVLLIAAVPSFADFLDRYRLRGAVDDVVSVLANARAESVKGDTDINIKFGGSSASDWCVGANAAAAPTGGNPGGAAAACNCTVTTECMVAGTRLATGVGLHERVTASSNTATFVFDSKLGTVVNAGAVDDPAAVTFTSPSGKYDINVDVNALGQSTVCTPVGKPGIAGISVCP